MTRAADAISKIMTDSLESARADRFKFDEFLGLDRRASGSRPFGTGRSARLKAVHSGNSVVFWCVRENG
jgi:hypothetical protein